jgi:electron transfer flavoprotein beta subunit
MKVFVCIKQVPDTETKIKIRADQNGIDTTGIKWIMNPYDEYAVEEALKLREAGKCTSVVVLSLGPKSRVVEALRTALAMGADEAIVIDAPEDIDATSTAKGLAAAIKAEGELKYVLTGKLAIDDNNSAVSQMLADYLGLPHASVVSKMTVSDNSVLCEREVEGGTRELIELTGPALVAANKGLNMPRYASLPGIMKAKKKVIKELVLTGLDVGPQDLHYKFTGFQLPPEKPQVKMLAGEAKQQVEQLAQLLRNEAKVL